MPEHAKTALTDDTVHYRAATVRRCEEIEIFAKATMTGALPNLLQLETHSRGDAGNFDEAAADLYRPDLDPFIGQFRTKSRLKRPQ